jgi:hypothetical protein
LLEAEIVLRTDSSDESDLFSPQPRYPSSGPRRKAHLLGLQKLTTGTKVVSQPIRFLYHPSNIGRE